MDTAHDLAWPHRFVRGTAPASPPLLLLHGTGGNEDDLLPLGQAVAKGATLLSPRGTVSENGMPRFFRRLAEGVFDEPDLRHRTAELAEFIEDARDRYGVAAPVAVGFSNGANIAASRQPRVRPVDRARDVNWMTAGQGITHSERTAAPSRTHTNRLFGIQSWLALSRAHEETTSSFVHHAAATLPIIEAGGTRLRLIAGHGWGQRAPVQTPSELFYADAVLQSGVQLPMPDDHEERGAYVVEGDVEVAGVRFEAGRMLLFRATDRVSLRAGPNGARLLLLGGAAMDGPRHLFWNFVSSSRERIEQAKADWKAGRFATVPGDDKEFIPLPERRGAAAPTQ